MKKNQKKILIELYNKFEETGKMKEDGLCATFIHYNLNNDNLMLFKPTNKDFYRMLLKDEPRAYWGSENWKNNNYTFTPLRKTILAFVIAMTKD